MKNLFITLNDIRNYLKRIKDKCDEIHKTGIYLQEELFSYIFMITPEMKFAFIKNKLGLKDWLDWAFRESDYLIKGNYLQKRL